MNNINVSSVVSAHIENLHNKLTDALTAAEDLHENGSTELAEEHIREIQGIVSDLNKHTGFTDSLVQNASQVEKTVVERQ